MVGVFRSLSLTYTSASVHAPVSVLMQSQQLVVTGPFFTLNGGYVDKKTVSTVNVNFKEKHTIVKESHYSILDKLAAV